MPRIVMTFPDGSRNIGYFVDDGDDSYIEIGAEKYSIKTLKDSGAVVVVNNDETLRRFTELGMPARPTPRQYKFTVSVSANTYDRLREACKKEEKNASRIIENLLIDWLNANGY